MPNLANKQLLYKTLNHTSYLRMRPATKKTSSNICCGNSERILHTFIRKTFPCNKYPLKPHFYTVKMGYARVYLFFLFLLQNIDCGYSLEPPQRGGSNVYPQSVLSKSKKNIQFFPGKFFIFTTKKFLYIAWTCFRNDRAIPVLCMDQY